MVPTTNITVSAVRAELKESTYKIKELCTSPKVNIWSKYKPIRLNTPIPDRKKDWWKGDNLYCGFTPYMTTDDRSLLSIYTSGGELNGWLYEKVTTSDWCRLADFGGYDQTALPPINQFSVDRTVVDASGNQTLHFNITLNGGSGKLAIGDIGDFANCYFGVLLSGGGNKYIKATSTAKLTNSAAGTGQEMSINVADLPIGNITAYPFISRSPIVQGQTEQVNIYYTLPGVKQIYIQKVESLVTLDFSGEIKLGNRCYITVTVNNRSASTLSIKNGAVYYRFPSNGHDDPILIGETKMLLLPKTVASNSSYTYDTVNADVADILTLSGKVRVWCSINSSSVVAPYRDFYGDPI